MKTKRTRSAILRAVEALEHRLLLTSSPMHAGLGLVSKRDFDVISQVL